MVNFWQRVAEKPAASKNQQCTPNRENLLSIRVLKNI
jgi:hypothetical protein